MEIILNSESCLKHNDDDFADGWRLYSIVVTHEIRRPPKQDHLTDSLNLLLWGVARVTSYASLGRSSGLSPELSRRLLNSHENTHQFGRQHDLQ